MVKIPQKVKAVLEELNVDYTLEQHLHKTKIFMDGEYIAFVNDRGDWDERNGYKEVISRIRSAVRAKRGQLSTTKIGEIVDLKEELEMNTKQERYTMPAKESPELMLLRQIAATQTTILQRMDDLSAAVELSLESQNTERKVSPRNMYKNWVIELMADNVSRHIHEIYKELSKKDVSITEQQISQACVGLCNNGELSRLRTGIYVKTPV